MKQVIINKIKINELKPLRKNFKNKNKKFAAIGYYKNIKVKVYEVFDKHQGKLRKFVSNNKNLSKYFPKLITFNNKFIVEEWVEGKTLKELNLNNFELKAQSKKIKKFINIMWSTKFKYLTFDYIEYIHKRVNNKNSINLSNVPIRINHNDLSLDNIILSPKGLKIIDNEFLGCSKGWILNIRNSFLIEDFDYQKFVSKKTLNHLWFIRQKWNRSISKKNKKNQFLNFIKRFITTKTI